MWVLLIVMVSTIGVQHPVKFGGPPAPAYPSRAACEQAGDHVVEWLTQDHVVVSYQCKEVAR